MTIDQHHHIWLIRHGQSAANAGLTTQHPRTIPLTDLGREQARNLVHQVKVAPQWLVVSPFDRTLATAEPLLQHFGHLRPEVWPIQEFTYLSPARCAGTNVKDRRAWAEAYWTRCDPNYRDAADAETFAELMARCAEFRQGLQQTKGFGLVVGHGLFLKAFLIACEYGFRATPESMRRFRRLEVAKPLVNAEPISVDRRNLSPQAAANGQDPPKPSSHGALSNASRSTASCD